MLLIIIASCSENNSKNGIAKIEKVDSLVNVNEVEGYEPEHKIDFSHSIHAEQKLTNDCNYCHKQPNTKVNLNLCAECHNVNMNNLTKLDYYDQLDSISAFVRNLHK
jgi:hypothetical protein